MKNALIVLTLLLTFWGVRTVFPDSGLEYAEPTMVTGLVLIAAYLVGLLLKKIRFPKLTGYMLLGLLIGPIGLNFLTIDVLDRLKFLEDLALSFIAMTAGGEFKYSRIRKQIRSILFQLTGQLNVVFFGMVGLLIIFSPHLPFMKDLEAQMAVGFAILFASTALSTSPATTIGIITELKARGYVTKMVLSITIVKSIIVVMVFPVLIAMAKLYLIPGTVINTDLIFSVFYQISGSILTGTLIGLIIIVYLKYIKIEKSIFLLGIAIIITELSLLYNMEILLTSIIAGIMVENFSKKGEELIINIEKSSLPFYIIFFGFAGASLHLDAIVHAFSLTLFIVLARFGFLFVGNYLGAFLAKETAFIRNYSWMGYMGQAGIAVGLGTIIEKTFPGPIGESFKTILIASVVINELLGPILFKYILVKAKESTAD